MELFLRMTAKTASRLAVNAVISYLHVEYHEGDIYKVVQLERMVTIY